MAFLVPNLPDCDRETTHAVVFFVPLVNQQETFMTMPLASKAIPQGRWGFFSATRDSSESEGAK